MLVFKARLTNS